MNGEEDCQEFSELIICRFHVLRNLICPGKKRLKLLRDRNTGELAMMKMYPGKNITILTEASFLETMQGHIGIPNLIWAGQRHEQAALISEYLGLTLNEHFIQCGKKFSLKTVCMLGLKIIPIVQNYHEKGILLRKISLSTFQFGRGEKCKQLYLNDLGDSKRYRNRKTFEHIEFGECDHEEFTSFSTQARFCGKQLSRRDDIESVILMLIYMLKGALPWEEYVTQNSEPNFEVVNQDNQFTDVKRICKGLPKIFQSALQKCKSLSFVEEPNYFWLMKIFKALMYQRELQNDQIYDWMLKPSHNRKLQVCRNIPKIKLLKDEQILSQIYYPYAEHIPIDDLTEKHKEFLERKNQLATSQTKSLTQSTHLSHAGEGGNTPKLKSTISASGKLKKSEACYLM